MDVDMSNNVVQQWTFHGGTNQQWKLVYNSSDGCYSIIPMVTPSYFLDVDNAWDDNGTKIKIFQNTAHDAQRFRIIDSGTVGGAQTFKIQPKISATRVVDVYGMGTHDGANIHLWDYLNENNPKGTFACHIYR